MASRVSPKVNTMNSGDGIKTFLKIKNPEGWLQDNGSSVRE